MNTLEGKLVTPGHTYPARLRFGERVAGAEPLAGAPDRLLLPGFLDLHVHGGGGADCMDGEAAVRQVARHHARGGTTGLLATTVTAPVPDLEAALVGINTVVNNPQPGEARVLGVHLEGPFINPHKLGAQPPFAVAPDLGLMRHFMSLAPIRVVTLAPELPGALELIRYLDGEGVRVQMGHTVATYDEARAGFRAGARGFTHLYNAMTGLHHREPGVLGLALEQAEYAEVISDGLHVHPAALKAAAKAIPGLYTVTDAVEAAGMPGGEYRLGRHRVFSKSDGVFLEDGTLAGSTLSLDKALRNLLVWGFGLNEAVEMTSARAARYLGLPDRGGLETGQCADIVVMSEQFQVEQVYVTGERVT